MSTDQQQSESLSVKKVALWLGVRERRVRDMLRIGLLERDERGRITPERVWRFLADFGWILRPEHARLVFRRIDLIIVEDFRQLVESVGRRFEPGTPGFWSELGIAVIPKLKDGPVEAAIAAGTDAYAAWQEMQAELRTEELIQ